MLSLFFTGMSFAAATHAKLLTFFSDTHKRAALKVELAIVVDFGMNFIKATYQLEGDSLYFYINSELGPLP